MIQEIITGILIIAAFAAVYRHLYSPKKKQGCDSCRSCEALGKEIPEDKKTD